MLPQPSVDTGAAPVCLGPPLPPAQRPDRASASAGSTAQPPPQILVPPGREAVAGVRGVHVLSQGGHFWCQEKHTHIRCPVPLGALRLRGPGPQGTSSRTTLLDLNATLAQPRVPSVTILQGLAGTRAHAIPSVQSAFAAAPRKPHPRSPTGSSGTLLSAAFVGPVLLPLACRKLLRLSATAPPTPRPADGISLPVHPTPDPGWRRGTESRVPSPRREGVSCF